MAEPKTLAETQAELEQFRAAQREANDALIDLLKSLKLELQHIWTRLDKLDPEVRQ